MVGNGSETRNSLHHIHNGKDIIMATTCRHMNNWSLFADARCAADNDYYETYVKYHWMLIIVFIDPRAKGHYYP